MKFSILALVAFARVAHADVGVVVAGEPLMQAPVMSQVQGWVQDHDYQLVGAPLGTVYANTFIDCFVIEDLSCARGVFEKQSRATSLVYVRVDMVAVQTTREITLTGYWFVRGRDPVQKKRSCPQCDDAGVGRSVDALMKDLLKASSSSKGQLKVTSTRPGVDVHVDKAKIGEAPIVRELAPGTHEVAFFQGDQQLASQRVALEPGGTVELAIPATADDGRGVGPARSRALPAGLLAGGVIAAVAGSVFLYYGQLDGPDEPYVYTNATEIGAVLTIGGAASVILGSVLWFRAAPVGTPTVSLGRGGAQLGWAGAF